MLALGVLAACSPSAPTQAPAPSAPAGQQPAGQQPAAPAKAGATTIRYALWDSNQQPAYQQCVDAFQKKNPNITVKIEQAGWGDYWSSIQTGMVSGTAPDVFTNHLAKYPEFAQKGQLVDIEPLVKRDNVPTNIYVGQLAELWSREGKRYGLPKDWDTVAIVYNADMLKKANIDPATIKDWTWNAQDGGTFGQAIAKLSIDSKGNDGTSPNFDPKNVTQYGFIHQGSGGFAGQTQWSMFAVSNGFKFIDAPWSKKYYYDDPKLAETMAWYYSLVKKGFAPPLADVKSLGGGTLFQSGKGAMTTDGSWTINDYLNNSKFQVGFGLLPKGPNGRKSMFNGLADSIWVGSKNQDAAWQWVKFAASPECADLVGATGVVFPAIKSGVDKSLAFRKSKNVDVSAFTEEGLDNNVTFLFPITDNGAQISNIMDPLMDSIMLGQAEPAAALKDANAKVNALFK
ncbi:MAG: sugar ABC transporter substrate-binding protein [Anaerolineae bacterium]|nr:sugar ABC transporter substrate-binding protein [Anaerolineae bacterium]